MVINQDEQEKIYIYTFGVPVVILPIEVTKLSPRSISKLSKKFCYDKYISNSTGEDISFGNECLSERLLFSMNIFRRVFKRRPMYRSRELGRVVHSPLSQMSEITEGHLYLGSLRIAMEEKQLKKEGITDIINGKLMIILYLKKLVLYRKDTYKGFLSRKYYATCFFLFKIMFLINLQ